MKYILLLILTLTLFKSHSQDTTYIELDTSSLIINHSMTKFVLDNFLSDACDHGLDSLEVINHIKNLDGIYTDSLSYDKLGVTICINDSLSPTGVRGIIIINEYLLRDYSIFRLTLYHELTHWFGLEHKSFGIMSKNSKHAYRILKNWDRNVKKLMRKIKRNGYSYPKP